MKGWSYEQSMFRDLDNMLREHREKVASHIAPLVAAHYPELTQKADTEYRKMVELSTKMSMVGRACTYIANSPFDDRRLRISALFGACCFLGDSFVDDFGMEVAKEYIDRFEVLLTEGWFEVRNERERLFYVVLSHLFKERDILAPMLRQAIFLLFLAQKRDVAFRLDSDKIKSLPRQRLLNVLRECSRDRSGHAINVLSLFLVPEFPLHHQHQIYTAGSLIMNIDDHGDCYFDRHDNRITYMNQVKEPAKVLRRIFNRDVARIYNGLPAGKGRDLLIAFLYRYFVTRLKKHTIEKHRGAASWTVYE